MVKRFDNQEADCIMYFLLSATQTANEGTSIL